MGGYQKEFRIKVDFAEPKKKITITLPYNQPFTFIDEVLS